MPITALQFLIMQDTNMSVKYRKMSKELQRKSIQKAPAYNTRLRDDVYVPDETTYVEAYKIVDCSYLPTKTRETAFQILNRTIWTKNKANKSGMAADPHCERCSEVETMEHLIYGCPHYSEKTMGRNQ